MEGTTDSRDISLQILAQRTDDLLPETNSIQTSALLWAADTARP